MDRMKPLDEQQLEPLSDNLDSATGEEKQPPAPGLAHTGQPPASETPTAPQDTRSGPT